MSVESLCRAWRLRRSFSRFRMTLSKMYRTMTYSRDNIWVGRMESWQG